MLKLKNTAFILCMVFFLGGCGKTEKAVNETVSYNFETIKGLYNDEINKYYNGLEDYKKNGAEVIYFDIDKNTVPELFLKTWEGGYDVYTADNENLYKCGSVYAPLYKSPSDTLVSIEDFGGSNEGCREYTLEDNLLKSEIIFSLDSDGSEKVPQPEKGEIPKTYSTLKEEYSKGKIESQMVYENIDKLDELFPKT